MYDRFDMGFSDLIKWKTRLYGYTTYERTEVEWENTFTFQFNKYISTNIFIYPRFDDGSSVRHDDYGYWQFKEYASIGLHIHFDVNKVSDEYSYDIMIIKREH